MKFLVLFLLFCGILPAAELVQPVREAGPGAGVSEPFRQFSAFRFDSLRRPLPGHAGMRLQPAGDAAVTAEFECRNGGLWGVACFPGEGKNFFDFTGWTTLEAEVTNLDPERQTDCWIQVACDPPSGSPYGEGGGPYSRGEIALDPGETRVIRLPLQLFDRKNRITLPLVRRSDRPDGVPGGDRGLYPDRVTAVCFLARASLYVPHNRNRDYVKRLRIRNVRLTRELPVDRAVIDASREFFPFIDVYGQYIHSDWKEKIHSDADLIRAREIEAAELARLGRPVEWNRFGGWKNGPQLESTGFFRTEKTGGRWALVDPDGRLFFSTGLCGVHYRSNEVPVEGRADWFETDTSKLGRCWYPMQENLRRKYGSAELSDSLRDLTHRRLAAWGLNTIGAWSERRIYFDRKTPYIVILADKGDPGQFAGRLYDPYDPAFRRGLEKRFDLEDYRGTAGDPWCIGYFVHNELDFGTETHAARTVLRAGAKTPAKREFLRQLITRYGSLPALSEAWGKSYPAENDFLEATEQPDTPEARRDQEEFSAKMADDYYRICREVVKKFAPNQLYMGNRCNGPFAWLNRIMARHCDVISLNIYAPSPEVLQLELPDKPVLYSEFYLSIRRRGMFSRGDVCVGISLEEQLLGVRRYLRGVTNDPRAVGWHWFAYHDQPLAGRSDGENVSCGLVDIGDTPYSELAAEFRAFADRCYPELYGGDARKGE